MLQQAKPFVDERQSKTFWFEIRNTDCSVGASLSGYIAATHGDQGLAADLSSVLQWHRRPEFRCVERGRRGTVPDRHANDYVGKGMAGGLIANRPPVGSAFRSHEASIIGNTCRMARPVVVCMPQAARVNVSACGIRRYHRGRRHWRQRL
ncbi:hypothetical protein ACLK1S_20015 [Escherichia coli]